MCRPVLEFYPVKVLEWVKKNHGNVPDEELDDDDLNKPGNQDKDALGIIEQQQDFVILNLTLRVLDND